MARPRRPVPNRPRRRSIWVFTEGKVTEEGYVNFYHRRHRGQVTVTIDRYHGAPIELVERAISTKRSEEREQRRRRSWAPDEFWCVFDVDTHPKLAEAQELAAQNDIDVAVSGPCIELWFALHFADQTAYLNAREAQKLAAEHLSGGKRLSDEDLEALAGNFEVAKARAIKLDEKHRGDRTAQPWNPYSDVWRLIDAITGDAMAGE
jgi:RloB-like protein